jgi:L-amino acid N-acyltransferase YncA
MAGVQVWDDKPCSVELLAYVAKDIWSLGIGTRLLRWIIDIARQSGFIHEIFAATRAENERAISLARRVGFTEIGHGTHYGYPSIKWVLAL